MDNIIHHEFKLNNWYILESPVLSGSCQTFVLSFKAFVLSFRAFVLSFVEYKTYLMLVLLPLFLSLV